MEHETRTFIVSAEEKEDYPCYPSAWHWKAEDGRVPTLERGTYDVTFVLRADPPTPRPGWQRHRDGEALGGGLTGWAPEEYWARNFEEGWHTWEEREGEPEDMPEPEPRAPRPGWKVRFPFTNMGETVWVWEKDAQNMKDNQDQECTPWPTWPTKRVAREDYQILSPHTNSWHRETVIEEWHKFHKCHEGWEYWESRPIQEPEPEPEPKDEGPGLREAVDLLSVQLDPWLYSEDAGDAQTTVNALLALTGAVRRSEEQDAKVKALVEAVGEWEGAWRGRTVNTEEFFDPMDAASKMQAVRSRMARAYLNMKETPDA